MKKLISVLLAVLMIISICSTISFSAEEEKPVISFNTEKALYVHAVAESEDTEAWSEWQCVHDEDYGERNRSEKYFFLPSSADSEKVDIYNAFSEAVTVNEVEIASGKIASVSYEENKAYDVKVESTTYKLRFIKSGAEAAIYANNSDADGKGTDLFAYLSSDKSYSAKASGAVVTPDGKIDNTEIKKIKGRGNTTWGKSKKPFNITYDKKVSIAGMDSSKKYSLLANYQDDSLSRNRFLYDLSDAVGMPYASDSRYVDFYINGYYWGSYQLTEKIEVGKSSLVNDFEEEDYLDKEGNVKEDFPFLCEVDAGATDGEDYYVKLSGGLKITIKAPELSSEDKGYNEVKEYVKKKFDAFYNATRTRTADLTPYADVDSIAKIYLINELGKNWDAGVSSLYFTYKQDDDGKYKFYASPVWDYDNSLGNAVGIANELKSIKVYDYEEYTGWWCKYKGLSSGTKTSSNIMNRFAQNTPILNRAKTIWNEKFIPAINHFTGNKFDEEINKEFYTADNYFSLIEKTAEMNYTSGWMLNTGKWIADHSSLTKAAFDKETNIYSVNKYSSSYSQDFKGMYDYARDWMVSRAAWMSKQMADGTVTDKTTNNEEDAPPKAEPKLSSPSASLKAGAQKTIKVIDGSAKSWNSSDSKVAKVKSGKVTALKKGTATVTATLTNGKKLTCKVKVTTSPKLSKKSITVKLKKTKKIKITGKAKGVNNKYKNTKIAKIKSKKSAKTLKVKGLKKGKTTLKITVNGVKLKLKVKVK